MFWAMRWGSQPRGTWQFSMSHHTDVFTAAYSPIIAAAARPGFAGGEGELETWRGFFMVRGGGGGGGVEVALKEGIVPLLFKKTLQICCQVEKLLVIRAR